LKRNTVELICFNNIANPISAPSVRRFEKIIESTRRYDIDVVLHVREFYALEEFCDVCNLYRYIQRTCNGASSPYTNPDESYPCSRSTG